MKNKKNVFPVIIVMTVLFTFLCGCKSRNPEVNNGNIMQLHEDEKIEVEFEYQSLVIRNINENGYKEELVNRINKYRTADEGSYEYSIFTRNNLADIKDFYFPLLKIDGYELFCVEVTSISLVFYYAPLNPNKENLDKNGDYFFCYNSGIEILIRRPEYVDAFDPLKSITEQLNQSGISYLSKEDIIYVESKNDVFSKIGNTWFSVKVPGELNTYEFLRNLALRTIETIELVDVQAEIDIIRQSEN
ncbi:MAG: hypothetical protein LBC82_04760 [Oscillospiraceae bacterium]|jgi:hypothetical protein|nr:hypothetical protein [Oscillospiraceae bacterium]